MKIVFVDIETTALDSRFGRLLTCAIKPLSKRTEIIAVTKSERLQAEDSTVVRPAFEKIRRVDMIVGWNSYRFDVPFLNTRAEYYHLEPLPASIYHVDLMYVMKRQFLFENHTLEAACDFFGIAGKSHLNPDIWSKAVVGDSKAMAYVIDHNKKDVQILERLYRRVTPYIGQIRSLRY